MQGGGGSPSQILADQLTLSQSGVGADYANIAHHITTYLLAPLTHGFSELPYGPELVQGYVYVFSITAATANIVMLIAITIARRKTWLPQAKKTFKNDFFVW